MTEPRIPVSVLILAKNEAQLIARCIRSVPWADEVLVLDSGSTDATATIARQLGAAVHEQPWLGWPKQRARAIALARHDWVFVLEADEVVSDRLSASIVAVMTASPDPQNGYVVDRRDEFCGRLLPNMKRRSKRDTFVRLFHRRHSRYDPAMAIHEEVRYPGRAIPLPGILLHWRGSTVADIQQQQVGICALESDMLLASGVRVTAAHIVVRPILRFLWCYIYRGGFRAGTAGLVDALARSSGEFYRYARAWNAQSGTHTLTPDPALVTPDTDAATMSPNEVLRS